MAMDIDPFSMLEVSLQEDPDPDDRRHGSSAGVMHQVENDVQVVQPPPPFSYIGCDILTPQRAVLNNIQKLALTSKDEEKFRRRAYSSISLVLRKRLHCTICDAHIGAYLGLKEMDIEHPLLKVLACSKCTLKYHYLEFPLNPDGRDIRCRWCTESAKEESPLRFCSYCPFAFCEMCIYRNLPLDELASNKNSWVCFVCNVKDLWPSRAVLWALRVLIDTNLALKEEKKWSTDQSTCCKNKAVKQRRQVTLPPTVMTGQNGHNQPPPLRPIAPTLSNNFRAGLKNPIRPVSHQRLVRPIIPITPTRAVPMSSQNSTTQLYDTAWLTEKVQSISTTLLNLNNNLHRIAQGIPEKENKYSIKSKMISMVSLLNISATQLQKASKEMEEESKKILDKNYKVAKVNPVSAPSTTTIITPEQPIKIPEPKVVLKPVIIDKISSKTTTPARKRSYSSSGRNKRFKGSSEFDSEYEEDEEEEDFDDPDFLIRTRPEGEGPRTRLRTRACFVKLERLDDKIVGDLKSESQDGSEPQPSTSVAPDPLGTVRPEELGAVSGGDPKENGECGGKENVDVKEESEEAEKKAGSVSVCEAGAEVTPQSAAEGSPHPAAEKENVATSDRDTEAVAESGAAAKDAAQPAADKSSPDDADGSSKPTNDDSPPAANDATQPAADESSIDDADGSSQPTNDDSRPAANDATQPAPDASSEAAATSPSPDSADDSSPDAVDDSSQAKGSGRATPNDDSRPVAESSPRPADHGDSQPAGAAGGDESQSSTADDESEPAAEEDSRSSAKQGSEPAADNVPISGLNDANASETSPKANDSPTTTPDAVSNPIGSQIDAPGDDPLNESSATDSSITDSSTTSADTSDS